MRKRGVFLALVLVFAIPAAVGRAATQPCYYDRNAFLGIGCTADDMVMVGLKTGMALAAATGDLDTYFAIQKQAMDLENEPYSLSVKLDQPLSRYLMLDSVAAGANIRFATIPVRGGIRLLITDRLGRRPIRVTAARTAGLIGRRVDWWQSVTTGYALPDVGEYVLQERIDGLANALFERLRTPVVHAVDGASAGSNTLFQVDVLHTDPKGNRTVYRKQVLVTGNGQIRVTDVEKPWVGVRTLFPGENW